MRKSTSRILSSAILLATPLLVRATTTGTTGDDFLFFNGSTQTVTANITNPYTGESYVLNNSYNVNIDTYDGLAGNDTLLMTNVGDYFPLRNASNQQTLFNVERIVAGDGDDVIDMADSTFTQGNLFIDGGPANDILWGNVGNDTMQAAGGNDTLNGGPGNDSLLGQDGDDIFIFALGMGHDTISGGNGTDEIDFRPGITVSDLHYTGTTPGTIPNMEFDVGTAGDHISINTLEQFRFADNSTINPTSIPEPTTLATLLLLPFLTHRPRRHRHLR